MRSTVVRDVGWLAVFLMLGSSAAVLAPSGARSSERPGLSPPAPPLLLQVAALGRYHAAADLLWLRAVQFIGTPGSEASGYPGLGAWMQRITHLSPAFEAPYFTAGILLATVVDQTDEASELLGQAERNLVPPRCAAPVSCVRPDGDIDPETASRDCAPCAELEGCNWEIPLWRGFVSYFGQLDTKTAAVHYCESRRRGGPEYLSRFVARLARQVDSCRALRSELVEVLSQSQGDERAALINTSGQLRIVLHCEENALKQAAGAYRLRFAKDPTSVEDLISTGLAERPFAPPGQCWMYGTEGFVLQPCSAPSP